MIAAAIEHDHAVGVAEHDVHVVLGEQHRDALCAREVGGELHQRSRERGDMPGGRLVHQQQPRRAGERQRELHALGVAVGERRAALVGEAASSAPARAARRPRRANAALARRSMPLLRAGVREQRELRRSRAPSSTRTSRRPGTCGRRRSRAIARGGRPSMRAPASVTLPASGASWPLTRLKQVVLPAPLGPISATISPAATANDTSSHRVRRRRSDLREARRRRSTGAHRHRAAVRRAHAGPAQQRAAARRRCPSETRAR